MKCDSRVTVNIRGVLLAQKISEPYYHHMYISRSAFRMDIVMLAYIRDQRWGGGVGKGIMLYPKKRSRSHRTSINQSSTQYGLIRLGDWGSIITYMSTLHLATASPIPYKINFVDYEIRLAPRAILDHPQSISSGMAKFGSSCVQAL